MNIAWNLHDGLLCNKIYQANLVNGDHVEKVSRRIYCGFSSNSDCWNVSSKFSCDLLFNFIVFVSFILRLHFSVRVSPFYSYFCGNLVNRHHAISIVVFSYIHSLLILSVETYQVSFRVIFYFILFYLCLSSWEFIVLVILWIKR